ncbi:MAG: FKBP-type peptidyl-prolyl cis-trans isomerase [Prevotellaceae bacterium]|jgi:FKBP-type peptidyl-prolyl cis-trans isomerase SlyD|nr:FKBP-type peptidyl-prolyl cis-trans isomerase [Prevotellaceae bacterium]
MKIFAQTVWFMQRMITFAPNQTYYQPSNYKIMETMDRYITVAYKMYAINADGTREMLEEATAEHPFQFISGYGTVLDAFEQSVAAKAKGETFAVEIPCAEAYGEFDHNHILDLSIDIFKADGHLDRERIAPNKAVQLNTADGRVVNALIEAVDEAGGIVTVNLNHPLAGRNIAFEGMITENRPATADEVQGLMNLMNHHGCDCCGGCHSDCGSGCADEGCGCSGGCH